MTATKALGALVIAAIVLLAIYAQTYVGNSSREQAAGVATACHGGSLIARLTELPEASGLAASQSDPNLLWSHNDSSGPFVVGIGHDGSVRARVRVTGAVVENWEAITTGPCPGGSCLYIGDIGDNRAIRSRVTIYRMREPAATDSATQPAEAVEAVYPDGPRDAEAMFATSDGSLYIVTKGDGAPVGLYRLPNPYGGSTPAMLQRVASLTTFEADQTDRVTDAAVSPDGKWIALRTSDRLLFYPATAFTSGRPGTPRAFDLRRLREPQGEGLAWTRDNTLYLAGEGAGGGTLARVSCNLPSS